MENGEEREGKEEEGRVGGREGGMDGGSEGGREGERERASEEEGRRRYPSTAWWEREVQMRAGRRGSAISNTCTEPESLSVATVVVCCGIHASLFTVPLCAALYLLLLLSQIASRSSLF